MLLLDTDNLDI